MFQELSQDIEKTIVFDKYKRDFRSIPYYLEVLIGERKFVPEHFRGAGYLNVRTPRIKLTAPGPRISLTSDVSFKFGHSPGRLRRANP
jgi:hypothetical protein